jgi:hypothetical protein
MTDNLQERNDQLISNIKTLQSTEMNLYNSLENQNLSADERKLVIDKINLISQMRIDMYANLKDTYSNYQQNVSFSRNIVNDQMLSVDVIENELNDSKRRLNMLEEQKNNKIRLVEINTYYGKKYNAHKEIMQIIVLMCIPILILTVLANKGIIPSKLNIIITGLIIVFGLTIIGYKIIDISNRDNINYDEYNWYFNKEDAPAINSPIGETADTGPWDIPSIVCVGSECCDANNIYDEQQNKCIPTAQYNANQKKNEELTTREEAFVSGVLSKYAYLADYPTTRLQENVKSYNY